jgi:hypothetical protein
MKLKLFLTIINLFLMLALHAQTNRLIIHSNIGLPTDTTESKLLISTLNDFLNAAQKPNEDNQWVLPAEKIETYILLDEINGIERSGKFKDNFFYKPYLTNVVLLKDKKYLLQVSYIGLDEKKPLLRASFSFIAHSVDGRFLYASPLLQNTKNWQKWQAGNDVFHYKTSINKKQIANYTKMAADFDKKLKSTNKITEFYCCDNFVEVQKLIGVDYKSDYNGEAENVLSSVIGNKKVIVLGNKNEHFDNFDPHDLWHDRLSLVVSRSLINKPIDEGCAYLYGGSWGMSWQEIFAKFKAKVTINKAIDWANYKENPVNFGDSDYTHLMVDYVINALIVQKLEKEKGFSAVWEFLNCGRYEKGNENYYQTLQKLTAITKANYNEQVGMLIATEIANESKLRLK